MIALSFVINEEELKQLEMPTEDNGIRPKMAPPDRHVTTDRREDEVIRSEEIGADRSYNKAYIDIVYDEWIYNNRKELVGR